jgi:hypothetical protein
MLGQDRLIFSRNRSPWQPDPESGTADHNLRVSCLVETCPDFGLPVLPLVYIRNLMDSSNKLGKVVGSASGDKINDKIP